MKIGMKKGCIIEKGRKMVKAVIFILGFISGMSFLMVVSCLVISSEESRREENEIDRCG